MIFPTLFSNDIIIIGAFSLCLAIVERPRDEVTVASGHTTDIHVWTAQKPRPKRESFAVVALSCFHSNTL